MIRGLIFDFDGLILETEGPIYQSWLELFQEFDADLPIEVWSTVIGRSSKEHFDPFGLLEEAINQKIDRQTLAPRRSAREIELVHTQSILPGIVEALNTARAKELKLGIASSSNRHWVTGHLERLGLARYFEIVHTSDDVERTKPDPELYNLALRSLGLKPQEAIVFEDSPNGVTAAKSAGIFVVAVPNPLTRQLSLDHADLRLDSLADLSLDEIIALAEQS
jgi:beta-phosphoglucomutase-like phosphatase (HAD superfamily)